MKTKSKPKKTTIAALAAALGRSRNTIFQWKQQGAPIDKGEAAVIEWAMANEKVKDGNEPLREAKLEVLRQTAERLRIANEVKRKELIPFETVGFYIDQLFGGCVVGELERLCEEFPALLKGKDEVTIAKECKRQLGILVSNIEKKLDSLDAMGPKLDAADPEAAKKIVATRV